MEKLYDLELQVEKTINNLNNIIKFIQINNLIEKNEKSFNIIKDNYETLTTQDVDLLKFDFNGLSRTVPTIIHPDTFHDNRELGAKATEVLQNFNGTIDSVKKIVKKANEEGQTTYLWHLNKTNSAEQEYQKAYEQEKKQYQEEYDPRRRSSNQTENQSQRSAGAYEEEYHNQNYYDFRNQTDRTKSRGFRQYNEEDESYDEDSWMRTQAKKVSEYVKSRINFKINKIPSTEKDYFSLKALYERKIRSLQYKIETTKGTIQSLYTERNRTIYEGEYVCSESNIDNEYNKECQEMLTNYNKMNDDLDILKLDIDNRLKELNFIISEQYRAYQSYYDRILNLYNQENKMVKQKMTNLLNIPKGMSTNNYFKKYLRIINNPPQKEIIKIRKNILENDSSYQSLKESIEILSNKCIALKNKMDYYEKNADEIKISKYEEYLEKYRVKEKQIITQIETKEKALSNLENSLGCTKWQYENFQIVYGHLANSEGAKRR